MKKAIVVNIKDNPAFDVYCGRTQVHNETNYETAGFHNPFTLGDSRGSRTGCIQLFREYFEKRIQIDLKFRDRVLQLRGRTLGCWCVPLPCHADVIAEWLNSQEAAR